MKVCGLDRRLFLKVKLLSLVWSGGCRTEAAYKLNIRRRRLQGRNSSLPPGGENPGRFDMKAE